MKHRTIVYFLAGLTLMMVSSCTSNDPVIGQAQALYASPDIGVVTDEDFRVLSLEAGDGAEAAGVQVGDVLLDITWIPSDEPVYRPDWPEIIQVTRDGYLVDPHGNPYVDATGRHLMVEDMVGDSRPPRPAPRPVDGRMETVPVSPLPEETSTEPVPTPRPSIVPPITVEVQPGGQPYTAPTPPPAADFIEKETVHFTEDNISRIKDLISFGVPLALTVQRDDQVLELTVDPIGPGANFTPVPDLPTPTSIPAGYYYF